MKKQKYYIHFISQFERLSVGVGKYFECRKTVNKYMSNLLEMSFKLLFWSSAFLIICFLFPGGLDLAIEGPSKADISCVDNKDGTCTVSYLPTLAGRYNILVKYNDEHIAGSPFTARIAGQLHGRTRVHERRRARFHFLCLSENNQRRSQVKVGSAADFCLDINETDLSLLTASIRSPSGRDEPCLLKRMPNNHIGQSANRGDGTFCRSLRPSRLRSILTQAFPSSPVRSASTRSAS